MTYKKPNIKDVASAAGVSTQTISRVLNNRLDVADDTRQHVLKIIDELAYYPSALARSMTSQRSYTIGVMTTSLRLTGPLYFLNAITAEIDRLGYSLLLKEAPSITENFSNATLRPLLDRQVDGIIWAIPEIGKDNQWLADTKLPVPTVFINTEAIQGQTVVCLDNFAGAYQATSHLVSQGYKSIGHISGPLARWEARERKRGWQTALQDSGLIAPEQACVEGDWSLSGGYDAAVQLFSQYAELDAVFASNDHVAVSILLMASRIGKKIPGQLGVVGFDNIPEAAFLSPPLTTVAQDYPALGQIAVQKLIELIAADGKAGKTASGQVMVTPHFVIRESSNRI